MKLLFVSNLFPDAADPVRGLDNACLLQYLRAHCASVRSVALRPTLSPSHLLKPGPHWHPRAEDAWLDPVYCPTPYVPKFGSPWNHRLMARALRAPLTALRKEGAFDIVLGSWLYPDGCALARLAPTIDFPFVLICQGSDAHQYLEIPRRRRLILEASRSSGGIITRSADLGRRLHEAGVANEKLHPIHNGVATSIFHAGDQSEAKSRLALAPDAAHLLFVGNFLPVKNPHLLVAAWKHARSRLPERDVRLIMIGGGPLAAEIRASAPSDILLLPGRRNPAEIADYMRAADLLCLSSRNEGVPNVILEALASGLPVVSTNVGGIAEVIDRPEHGSLVDEHSPEALGEAIATALDGGPGRTNSVRPEFSWQHTAERYASILEAAISGNR